MPCASSDVTAPAPFHEQPEAEFVGTPVSWGTASLYSLCLQPEGQSLLSQFSLVSRKVTGCLVRLGLKICDDCKFWFSVDSWATKHSQLPPFSVFLLTPQDTRIMSLAERAPVNSALPLGCFLLFQTLHLLSWTPQIHPEASSSRKPSLICKSLIWHSVNLGTLVLIKEGSFTALLAPFPWNSRELVPVSE